MNYLQLPDALFPYIRRWSGMQLAVWCDVYTMTINGRAYYRTNDQLAEMFGTDARSVRRLVQDLVQEGALSTRMDGKRRILTANKVGSWDAPVKQRRTDMSEDRNVRGQKCPGTDMSAMEDKFGHDGGQICPQKEDRNVPQIDKLIDKVIEKVIEKRDAKPKKNQDPVLMPFEGERFAEVWATWKGYKKDEKRFSYKSRVSEQEALSKLQKLSNNDEQRAIEIIQQSIANGWSGFFALRDGGHSRASRTVDAASTLEWLKSPRRSHGYY